MSFCSVMQYLDNAAVILKQRKAPLVLAGAVVVIALTPLLTREPEPSC